ncbi:UNKNOWN [Stylonychia lemnae]|uniref:Uncharacterized protein n=1 Tax=Stylonychia lemnae TaxID=5949 RepID=A0A078A8J0_STYLE|nr:UNKNOWN [Stylonychia lemnae]|eukprot:CDW78191.1 UNKNOWN [Stylonychia lemnae]
MNISGLKNREQTPNKPMYQQNYTTTNGDINGQFLITELGANQQLIPNQYDANPYQVVVRGSMNGDRPQTDESDRGNADNQIFHVKDAEPPSDFDAPYSRLPSNVKNVSQSLTFRNKTHMDEWNKIFEMEHADAIISDAFWYVICKVFKKNAANYQQYEPYQEFLLDRIAANYVSFTIVENVKLDLQIKAKFFENFFDIIAQSVFYSLFYAFPKSRSLLNNEMKRKLLNIFSRLFTGMKIKSAKYDHWSLDLGTGNILQGVAAKKNTNGQRELVSLADVESKKKGKIMKKSNRERIHMKYSPLVERYLITHKYETMNNVREWKMLLTQRTDVQKEIDSKFEKYKKIADQAVNEMKRLRDDYDKTCSVIAEKMRENEKAAAKHIETLKQSKKEKLENGGYSEYANMLVSIFNSEHVNNMADNQ